jgi:hypothetical protein
MTTAKSASRRKPGLRQTLHQRLRLDDREHLRCRREAVILL